MSLAIRLVKSFIFYLIVFLFIVLVVLIPRFFHIVPDSSQKFVMDFQYHLDWQQYQKNVAAYFHNLFVNGSLGTTRLKIPIVNVITEFMPRSFLVIFTAFMISYPFGVLKGIFDYRSRFKKRSAIGEFFTFFMLSLPDFFIIICVQFLFIQYIPWFKSMTYGYQHWYSFILPAILAAIYPAFYVARITSSAISAQEGEDYVKVARGKGFTEKYVLYKHVLLNCRTTILHHMSTVMLYILSNLLIIEYLMDFKGGAYRFFFSLHYVHTFQLGQKSIYEPDVVIGLAMVFIIILLLFQWISQIAAFFSDPRNGE